MSEASPLPLPVHELGRRAKSAAAPLALASTATKDTALLTSAELLVERADDVLAANAADVADARAAAWRRAPSIA